MLLFPTDIALEFVNDCERKDIRILGFDAFEPPTDDTIRCSLEDCLDLSLKEYWDYSVAELCDVARNHIRARGRMLFEFVIP